MWCSWDNCTIGPSGNAFNKGTLIKGLIPNSRSSGSFLVSLDEEGMFPAPFGNRCGPACLVAIVAELEVRIMAFLDLSGNRSGRGGDCGGECVVGMECEEPIPFGCLVVHGGGKFVTSSCWTAEPSPALNEKTGIRDLEI